MGYMDHSGSLHNHNRTAAHTSSTDLPAQQVSDAAGNKLGTEVRVGRIDLGFINRFVFGRYSHL